MKAAVDEAIRMFSRHDTYLQALFHVHAVHV
jgi:hypothetical protein